MSTSPLLRADIRTVIFDCDGVLFDSNHIKSDSFAATLKDESPADIEAFLAYHAAHGGVSRYEKFDWFYRDRLGRENWQDLSRIASATFARTVEEKLMGAPEVPGARQLLASLQSRGVKCFVVSGGAHDEVNRLIRGRGLGQYFIDVLGSPATKLDHLAKLQTEGQIATPGVFIGDARSDFEAALAFGLGFIFVNGYTLWADGERICRHAGHPIVNDLESLACAA